MYGAIIGDLAGSIYEFDQIKGIKNINIGNIIEDNSFYSDDTILTIAILDAIINKSTDYDKYLREYIRKYLTYKPDFKPYFKSSFSPGMIKWAKGNYIGTSCGNGAMMRISPVGYMFDTESNVIKNAYLATIPSHNSEESIEFATKIALIIYYLRKGLTKEEIYHKLNIKLNYQPFTKFNVTRSETIDNCLYAFYHSTSFEDAIRKTILMGGDTDTNACIVASLVSALYKIDDNLIEKANKKLPEEFKKVLSKTYTLK